MRRSCSVGERSKARVTVVAAVVSGGEALASDERSQQLCGRERDRRSRQSGDGTARHARRNLGRRWSGDARRGDGAARAWKKRRRRLGGRPSRLHQLHVRTAIDRQRRARRRSDGRDGIERHRPRRDVRWAHDRVRLDGGRSNAGLWKADADGRHATQLVSGPIMIDGEHRKLGDRDPRRSSGGLRLSSDWSANRVDRAPRWRNVGSIVRRARRHSACVAERQVARVWDPGCAESTECGGVRFSGLYRPSTSDDTGEPGGIWPEVDAGQPRGRLHRHDVVQRVGPADRWKAPYQLTHFTDGRTITDFAWSHDGKRLAIARSVTTNDIVLFKGLRH